MRTNIQRIARHLLTHQGHIEKAFPIETLTAIEQAIKWSEVLHVGEIRFVIEDALDCSPLLKGQSAKERAIDLFSELRIWDTEHNNGVLLYVLLADHAVEIVADRGIHKYVGTATWVRICQSMEIAFAQGDYENGIVTGILSIAANLGAHYPGLANQSTNCQTHRAF